MKDSLGLLAGKILLLFVLNVVLLLGDVWAATTLGVLVYTVKANMFYGLATGVSTVIALTHGTNSLMNRFQTWLLEPAEKNDEDDA